MPEVVTLKNFAELLRFKKANTLSIVLFGCLADPSCKEYLKAYSQTNELLGQKANASFAMIDVDECEGADLSTPFKLTAMPTTIFFREAKETARVENNDIPNFQRTFGTHMPVNLEEINEELSKKREELIAKRKAEIKEQQENFAVVSANYGNLSIGETVDVTARVRELLKGEGKGSVQVDREELNIPESFKSGCEKQEQESLRIVIDREGHQKNFTLAHGKVLHIEQCNYCFNNHNDADFDDQMEEEDLGQEAGSGTAGGNYRAAWSGVPPPSVKTNCGG